MKKPIFLFICIASLLFNLEIHSQDFPPDRQYTPVPKPELTRPDYLKPITDPDFGMMIVRITDSAVFGQRNVRHHYSKDQPWNCDMSLIMMDKWLLDGNTYKIVRKVEFPEEPRWSFKDPEKIFGVQGNSFVTQNIRTGKIKVLHTFDGFDRILIGPWEGNISTDDGYVAFQATKGKDWHIIVYDIKKDRVIATRAALDLNKFRVFDWVSMSQSGRYVIINWRQRNSGDGSSISYDRNLNKVADLFARGEHADIGYDVQGNEVLVQVCPFQFARLDNGEKTTFFNRSCGHLSMRAIHRPGWAYSSVSNQTSDLIALKLDGSGIIEYYTHHRSSHSKYIAESHAVASHDGKRIIFATATDKTSEDNS